MKCNNCGAELGENETICPNCGSAEFEMKAASDDCIPVTERTGPETQGPAAETEQTGKKRSRKIALAVVAVVVLLAVLVAVIVSGFVANSGPNDITCKESYTVTDDEVISTGDKVVATMEGRELTVSQLQVYYWLEVVNFLQSYGSYASYVGLDYTQPLDTQTCLMTETEMTWQQYFLECALDSWSGYQAMALEAEAAGLDMDPEMQEVLDGMMDSLDETAVEYGLADAEELIKSNFGAGATVESYRDFWELYYYGYTYYNHEYEKLAPTDEEIEAFFAENEASYEDSGITKDTRYVDVRHILVMVEGGTTDEEGSITYSEDEWAACEAEAQAILNEWLAGEATEDTFAALANEKSEDGGSNTNGGLYEDIYEGQMVENFENWCFDETRAYGDYGLVKTEYGYHIMYFVGSDEDVWYTTAKSDLLYELSSAMMPDAMEKHPCEINYRKIALGEIELS